MSAIHMALVARDGFFIKDGRGWNTSPTNRARSHDWPHPTTLRGALRGAWGRAREDALGMKFTATDWEEHTHGVHLGATFPLRRQIGEKRWKAAQRMWPVPADAIQLVEASEVTRLDPRPTEVATLGRTDDGAREGLWRPVMDDRKKPVPQPRWWTDVDLASWLTGGAVARKDREAMATARLGDRTEVHVSLDADTLVAQDGALFSTQVMETLTRGGVEWAIGIEASLPDPSDVDPKALSRAPWILGGHGRTARAEVTERELFSPPSALPGAFGAVRGLRLMVVTPTVFKNGWLPDGLAVSANGGGTYGGSIAGVEGELVLRAAFVPRPMHLCGWDLARKRPKPALRAVAPGAVYYFEKRSGAAFTSSEARALWLKALGEQTEDGLGRVVPGIWNPLKGNT